MRVSLAGATVVKDQRQGPLIVPEDEDADGHQGVGQQCPDGHEVHQGRQVKQEGHESCRGEKNFRFRLHFFWILSKLRESSAFLFSHQILFLFRQTDRQKMMKNNDD